MILLLLLVYNNILFLFFSVAIRNKTPKDYIVLRGREIQNLIVQ